MDNIKLTPIRDFGFDDVDWRAIICVLGKNFMKNACILWTRFNNYIHVIG